MIVSTVLIILFTIALYFLWIRPQNLMNKYARQLQKRGFSVLKIKYNPFRVDLLSTLQKGIKEGDAMKYYKEERSKYDAIVCNELTKPRIQLYHPDFRKDLFTFQKHYEFPKAPRIVNIFSRIAGRGLAFSQGEAWHRKRKILNKVFNFDFIKSQVSKISNIVEESILHFQQCKSNIICQGSFKFSIDDLAVKIFSSVMLQIFLGASSKETIDNKPAGQFIKDIMADITREAFKPLSAILGQKYTNLGITKAQREIIRKIKILKEWGIPFINKRLAEVEISLNKNKKSEPSDLIEALIMVKRSKEVEGQSISTQEQIFQEFITFFIAGTDTTSNFTTMMVYLLVNNPEIMAKVREQIDQNMKSDEYTFQNLKNFKYIDLVQKQTTRFYGPGTQIFVRYAKSDNYLNNILIQKGTIVGMMYVATHFNEKYFEKPLQFKPQRWQNEESNNLPSFVFGGFGGGARTCIGKHLALLQSKIALIKILKAYKRIELGKPDYKMEFKFLYCPENFQSHLHRF